MTEQANKYEILTRRHGDPWIWGLYLMLLIVSVVESYTASSREVAVVGLYKPILMHSVFLGLGGACVWFLHRIPYHNKYLLFALIPMLWLFTAGSLLYVMFFGEVVNGAQRAVTIAGISIQPAEFAKLSIVTMLSFILARTQRRADVSGFGLFLCSLAIGFFGALMFRSGLTNTLLLMSISGSMLLIGGAKYKKIFYMGIAYAVILAGIYMLKENNDNKEKVVQEQVLAEGEHTEGDIPGAETTEAKASVNRSDTWQVRIQRWLNRDSLVYQPINSKNQQEMFSHMAQAHGGITGQGIGNSRECSRLPLAFSDYIFSIIVEETGVSGAIMLLLFYLSFLGRAAMIARRCKRVLPALLVIGSASMITYQALFHMAINTGVFPVSGQPLPLVSKGGTSILVTSIAIGIMLSVSRTIANQRGGKSEDSPLPESIDAANPTQMESTKNEWR